jgi:hypothetical protein
MPFNAEKERKKHNTFLKTFFKEIKESNLTSFLDNTLSLLDSILDSIKNSITNLKSNVTTATLVPLKEDINTKIQLLHNISPNPEYELSKYIKLSFRTINLDNIDEILGMTTSDIDVFLMSIINNSDKITSNIRITDKFNIPRDTSWATLDPSPSKLDEPYMELSLKPPSGGGPLESKKALNEEDIRADRGNNPKTTIDGIGIYSIMFDTNFINLPIVNSVIELFETSTTQQEYFKQLIVTNLIILSKLRAHFLKCKYFFEKCKRIFQNVYYINCLVYLYRNKKDILQIERTFNILYESYKDRLNKSEDSLVEHELLLSQKDERIERLESEIRTIKENLRQSKEETDHMRSEVEHLNDRQQHSDDDYRKVSEQMTEQNAALELLQDELDNCRSEKDTIKKESEDAHNEIRTLNEQLLMSSEELSQLKQNATVVNQKINDMHKVLTDDRYNLDSRDVTGIPMEGLVKSRNESKKKYIKYLMKITNLLD